MAEQIFVKGLDDFRKGLRKLGPEYQKKLGQANKRAAQAVVDRAVALYGQRYTVRRGRVIKTIKALAQARAAKVRLGSNSVPQALGQEFGSNRLAQFKPWSGPAPGGVGSRGHFFYQAIREETPKLAETYLDLLDEVAKGAYPRGI